MRTILILASLALLAACELGIPVDSVESDFDELADKIKIDKSGKTECDGTNTACFDADCKKATGDPDVADLTDPCWCTHCDNGNVCEAYADHQAHDDKCTLES